MKQWVSVFDPVLCELMYRWFCPPEGVVLDPFAGRAKIFQSEILGGSVRGIVAAKMNLKYFGIELSGQQISSNKEQANEIGIFFSIFLTFRCETYLDRRRQSRFTQSS